MKIIRAIAFGVLPILALGLSAQTAPSYNPFQSLSFLEGTWDAKTNGSSGVDANGKYTFTMELRNHVMARHMVSKDSCKGPENYDCNHNDLLYFYPDGPEHSLEAIYFDNEGHVIKYSVSTPTPTTEFSFRTVLNPARSSAFSMNEKPTQCPASSRYACPVRANGSPTSNGVGKRIRDENAKQVVLNPKSSTNRIWETERGNLHRLARFSTRYSQ